MTRSACILFAGFLLLPVAPLPAHAFTSTDAQEPTAPAPATPNTAVILHIGVQGSANQNVSALSVKSCPVVVGPVSDAQGTTPDPIKIDPAILDEISLKMNERLSKKMTVLVDPAESNIPLGAMVISGCITRANPGNAATRLVGANVGASHLSVHVIALRKTQEGFHAFDDFALDVKGGDLLPPLGPIGLAVHAARDRRQTLSADAGKIANKILKKIAGDTKANQQTISGY
jgi:Domain of unknown function (DUF4410)